MSTITDLRRERKRRNRKRMFKALAAIVLLIAATAGSVLVYEKYLKDGEGIPGLHKTSWILPRPLPALPRMGELPWREGNHRKSIRLTVPSAF